MLISLQVDYEQYWIINLDSNYTLIIKPNMVLFDNDSFTPPLGSKINSRKFKDYLMKAVAQGKKVLDINLKDYIL